jgi:2-polyprenyl-3-methyl-5-hydroxy-6-metoxy-1,4-benzoquinol methylase
VLDVDGHVIAAEDLVNRVERLVSTIDESNPSPKERPTDADEIPDGPAFAAPILPMRALHGELYPPELPRPQSARGRASVLGKRIVRKLSRWYVEPRWLAQQNYDGHNIHFAAGVVSELDRAQRELEELRQQNIRLKLQLVGSVERLNRSIRSAQDHFATQDHFRELSHQVERLGSGSWSGTKIDYSAFEDRCRGSSEELREAQRRYLSLFPPPEGSGSVIDIGCGRGEMLELLIEAGYDVKGVELDLDMIDVCRSKGLPVVQDDGIHFLEQVEDGTLRGIFCAQVVEHLLTSELERLVKVAYEKLLPNAVMVMETINPRSLYALGNHFFADTSHVRPVHPETLRFICEQVGFSSVVLDEISPHALMETKDALEPSEVGKAVKALVENFFGYQDYIIVATK